VENLSEAVDLLVETVHARLRASNAMKMPSGPELHAFIADIATELAVPARNAAQASHFAYEEFSAFGQLQTLIDDPEVEEIWLNSPDRVFAAKAGCQFVTGVVLSCDALRRILDAMLLPTGRRLDTLSPFVDATLPDGSRLHVVAPNISRAHMAVNIRKFPHVALDLDDLIRAGMCTQEQADFLMEELSSHHSVLISGATHSGKTTLLRALAHELPAVTRVVTCEEVFELNLHNLDVAAMQTRAASLDGHGEVSLRQLVVQALRMRPDVVVIGEVRQAEAFDLLLALNSGVAGLCTVHANSAKAAVNKIATLALLAGPNVTADFVQPAVGECLDLVVHVERVSAGRRHIAHIASVAATQNSYTVTPLAFPRQKVA
jgi:pilus assembly protein CpaF